MVSALPLPLILGCAGPTLTDEERALFAERRPVGFILFRRNCVSVDQVRALVSEFRALVELPSAPVFIDQEGGRVQRLKAPVWREAPAAREIGASAERDIGEASAFARAAGAAIGVQLAECGITVDCAPCLDLLFPYTHEAIGDRAFHSDPAIVAMLGLAFAEGLASEGVAPMMKHMPGHGRAQMDSHFALPVIDAPLADLGADLAPFAALSGAATFKDGWGMVAHLQFPALDRRPASVSQTIIRDVIRGLIGFDGVLVTDDISMKALDAPVATSATRALEAGCDLVMHCNGEMAEMVAIATALAPMDDALLSRVLAASPEPRLNQIHDPGAAYAALARHWKLSALA